MKILHISYLSYTKAGGINFVVPRMVFEENKAGINTALLNLNNRPYPSDYILKGNRYISNNKVDLENILHSYKPDFAIFHGIYRKGFEKAGKVLDENNVKYLIKPHSGLTHFAQRQKKIKKWLANSVFYRQFFNNCFGTIYLNEKELQQSISLGEKKYIIPNGIQIEDKIPKIQENNKVINLTFIGRIDIYQKGLDILFEAIKSLDKTKIKFNFYGTGNEKDLENLSQMVRKQSDISSFYGPVYNEDKRDVLENTDIFIHTSRFEGQPMSILEALSFGIPCLISEETNVGDEITNYSAGWVCNLSSTNIANTINFAIEEYRKNPIVYKQNAYTLANNIFSWPAVIQESKIQYHNIFNDINYYK